MLTGFLRTVILFFVTTIVLRLMGKRQLAELQPYEVVITLMISDLATQPMNDVEIPLLSGVVPILTLLLMHSLLSSLSFWSIRLRAIICGRPSVLVRNGRICEDELSRLCFDLSDLMEGIRSQGLIGLQETGSVILETNGALSVLPRNAVLFHAFTTWNAIPQHSNRHTFAVEILCDFVALVVFRQMVVPAAGKDDQTRVRRLVFRLIQ